jgi:hypothetical protein
MLTSLALYMNKLSLFQYVHIFLTFMLIFFMEIIVLVVFVFTYSTYIVFYV